MEVPNFMPHTIQRALHLSKSLNNFYCYYSEFIDEETEAQGD